MTAFEPAFALLSALTSLPALLYYARAFGAAAVHPVRGTHGRIAGLRVNDESTSALLIFLGGTGLVLTFAGALNVAIGGMVSLHSALGAVVVAALWPQAREGLIRFLLLFLLVGAGASRVLSGADAGTAVLVGYSIGFCCAWITRRCLVGRKR